MSTILSKDDVNQIDKISDTNFGYRMIQKLTIDSRIKPFSEIRQTRSKSRLMIHTISDMLN